MASNAPVNLEELQTKFLECSICFEKFDEDERHPRLLPCLHTYCYTCLQNLHVRGEIICPHCQTKHTVNEQGLNTFPKDNTRRDLMDFVKASRNEQILCKMCDCSAIATHRCDCCKFICDRCVEFHKTVIKYKAHKLFPLQGPSDISLEHLDRFALQSFCKEEGHETKEIEMFCSSCQKTVCTVCALMSHFGHNFSLISKAFEDNRKNLSDAELKVKEKIKDIDKITKEIQNGCSDINFKGEEEKEKHSAILANAEEVLQRKESEVSRLIDITELEKMKILENQCSELQKLKESCIEACEFLDNTVIFENHAAFLEVWPTIEARMEKLLSTTFDLKPRTQACTFSVSYAQENLFQLQKVTDGLGKLLNSDVYQSKCKVIERGTFSGLEVGKKWRTDFVLKTVNDSVIRDEIVKLVIEQDSKEITQINCSLNNDVYTGEWVAKMPGRFTWHVTSNGMKINFPNNTFLVTRRKLLRSTLSSRIRLHNLPSISD